MRPSIAELSRLVSALSPAELEARCARPDVRIESTPDVRIESTGDVGIETIPDVRIESTGDVRIGVTPDVRIEATGQARIADGAHARWRQPELAGRLIELSGRGASAVLTLAFAAVHDAQMRGETAAWITSKASSFFPPDVAANGVDLDALVVVRLPRAADAAHAADRLARSSAFGIIVLDLERRTSVPPPLLTRLSGLARKHDTAVVFLLGPAGHTSAPSLGSLVSLRGEASRTSRGTGRFVCQLSVIKDRLLPRGWKETEVCRGPAGLR